MRKKSKPEFTTFKKEFLAKLWNPKARREEEKKKDKEWRLKILLRGRCEVCETDKNLTPHHIMKRSKKSTRHLEENGSCLCTVCHSWAESYPKKAIEFFQKKRGMAWWNDLLEKSQKIKKGE